MTDLDELEAALHAALTLGDTAQAEAIGRDIDTIPQPTPVPVLSAALWYAQAGLPVFPLRPKSKIPLPGGHGCLDATTDEQQIRDWWAHTPEANIGIATGHICDVVDIDGYAGQLSRAQNWQMFASLTALGSVLTPRAGGLHIYVPANPAVGNGAGLLPAVDYRGRGGYVVAPPSTTDVGTYRWLRPLEMRTA